MGFTVVLIAFCSATSESLLNEVNSNLPKEISHTTFANSYVFFNKGIFKTNQSFSTANSETNSGINSNNLPLVGNLNLQGKKLLTL